METPNLNEAMDSLPSMSDIVSSIKDNAKDVSEYLKANMKDVADVSLGDIHKAAVDKTSQGFSNADRNINGAINSIKGFGNGVADGVMMGVDAAKGAANYVADGTVSTYKDASKSMSDTYDSASKSLGDTYDSAKKNGGEAYDVVSGTISSMPDVKLGDVGNTIADGANYVAEGAGNIKDGAVNMASNAYDSAKKNGGEAYDVVAGTISSMPDVKLGDMGNTIADGASYLGDKLVGEAVAQEPSVTDKKSVVDNSKIDNLTQVSKLITEINAPKGYSIKVVDGVAGIYNNGGERIKYFTPNNVENTNLIDKKSIQSWVDNSINSYEKRYYNK